MLFTSVPIEGFPVHELAGLEQARTSQIRRAAALREQNEHAAEDATSRAAAAIAELERNGERVTKRAVKTLASVGDHQALKAIRERNEEKSVLVPAGQKVRGWLACEIPEKSPVAALWVEADIFGKATVIMTP